MALGEVATTRLGKMLSPASKQGVDEYPYLGNAEVQWGSLRLSNLRSMAFSASERQEFSLRRGDVLICEGGEVGRTAVVESDLSGVFFQKAIHRVRCSAALEPRFLYQYMRFASARGALSSVSSQATIMHLTGVKLRTLPIPLPPVDEQRRIAAVLDKVDDLRSKRTTSQSLTDLLDDSIFLDMFGEPVPNTKAWPVVPLAEISLEIRIGPFGSLLHQSDYVDGGVPLVNPMHITNDVVRPDPRHAISQEKAAELRRYVLRRDDIVMARRGEMGRCAVVDDQSAGMVCGSGSLFIRPDQRLTDPRFLHQVLTSASMKVHLERKALGVTMANLNSSIVGELPIPSPPLELQKRFTANRSVVALHRARLSHSAHVLDELLGSLQQRAFAGQL